MDRASVGVSTPAALLTVLVVAVMTYSMRAVVIVALAERTIPVNLERILRYVGPAVLSALAINLAAGGEGGPSLELAEAVALVVTGVVAWWRRNLIITLLAGMTTLYGGGLGSPSGRNAQPRWGSFEQRAGCLGR